MHKFRITKYNPAKRDKDGAYLEDDWTDASDIGKLCNGIQLTSQKFLEVEALYVEAALRFFDASGLSHVRVTCLEDKYKSDTLKDIENDHPDLYDPNFAEINPYEDQPIERAGIEQLCRMNLRNILWCKLEVADSFFIHFGWDFYMYVGIVGECATAADQTVASGLFVEDFVSPYSAVEGKVPRFTLSVWKKDSDDDCDEITLKQSNFQQIGRIFSYSDEHPMYGNFTIPPSMVSQLQPYVDINLDAEKFSYNLDTTGYEGDGFIHR